MALHMSERDDSAHWVAPHRTHEAHFTPIILPHQAAHAASEVEDTDPPSSGWAIATFCILLVSAIVSVAFCAWLAAALWPYVERLL